MENKEIDLNNELLKRFVEVLRPQDEEIRKQVDIGYSWDGSIAILYEVRPRWNSREEILHNEFAKIRYHKSRGEWNLYWMRANGKWEAYKAHSVASNLQKLLDVIKEDKHHCFFG